MNKAPRPYSLDAFPVVLPNYLWVHIPSQMLEAYRAGWSSLGYTLPFHLIAQPYGAAGEGFGFQQGKACGSVVADARLFHKQGLGAGGTIGAGRNDHAHLIAQAGLD